jgi:D-beta-D-heptose 7-phosphate kinase/D-beta-D-heptose 1-phosphate adenosyltransferase
MGSTEKILSREALRQRRAEWRAQGKRVVFTNGCFDLLHPGHLRTLEGARALGDVLVVGLNSDASVLGLKGNGRPLMPERERAEILAALECVDAVTIFDEPTPLELIRALIPDVLAKGGDWGPEEIVGRAEVEAAGGRVVALPYEPGYSTSALIERIVRTSKP